MTIANKNETTTEPLKKSEKNQIPDNKNEDRNAASGTAVRSRIYILAALATNDYHTFLPHIR